MKPFTRFRSALVSVLLALALTLASASPHLATRSAQAEPIVVSGYSVDTASLGLDVDESMNRVYVANFGGYGGYGSYSVVDIETGSSQSVPIQAPQDVVVNDVTGKVYISGAGDLVSVVSWDDPLRIQTTIPTGQTPKWMAVNEVTNRIYVAIHDGKALQVIDGTSDTTIALVDLSDRNPTHAAVDLVLNRIYVTAFNSRGQIAVIDGETNQVIGNLSVRGDQFEAVVDQNTGRLYVTSYDAGGWVTVFEPDGRKLAERRLSNRVTGIALNPAIGRLYVSNEYAEPSDERSQSVSILDLDLNEHGVIKVLNMILGPALGVDEVRSRIYAANTYSAVIGPAMMIGLDGIPNAPAEPAGP